MSHLFRRVFTRRTFAYASVAAGVSAGGGYYYLNSGPTHPTSTLEKRRPPAPWTPPTRAEMLSKLKSTDPNLGAKAEEEYDLLIVGGGATGAGVAVDAASRGLRVALVERDDFSAGTSSKSTKLVHGGVRYLQKAVFEADYEQYKLVVEALHERKIFLQTANYLSEMLPIMLPVYKYWQVPYYYAGCKMYDILAGKENMESSYLMTKGQALETFPMLKSDGLVGAVVYYDGQHNDSRMNMALIMSAVKAGAVVANYCEVTDLHKDGGKLNGARLKDALTGEEWNIKAKGVINATGPFTDTLLTMDNPAHSPIVQASSGIHITLPNYYSPRKMGLLDPATSDGRVIFFLPWQGNTIAGTTDTKAEVERDPKAREEEIRWVLDEVRRYLSPDIKVRRGDVLSAWSGLRPLVRNPNAASTEGLVRNHMIHVSDSGLLTIAGGKWTTYRAMAQETVDEAVKVFGFERKVKSGCVTEKLKLVGSEGWSRNMFIGLIQRYGLETDVAKHLANNYGDRAYELCELAEPTGKSWPVHGIRMDNSYPFIEAEIRYAIKHEYAQTAIDVLARRTRLSFLNVHAALRALPRTVEVMGQELGWSRARKWAEIEKTVKFLESMGLGEGEIARVSASGFMEPKAVGAVEHVQSWVWGLRKALFSPFSVSALSSLATGSSPTTSPVLAHSRSKFESGEVGVLKALFEAKAGAEAKLALKDVYKVVKEVPYPGYEEVSRKDWDYVIGESGYAGIPESVGIDFHEFVEICGNLKEVSFAPGAEIEARRRIPVEKSGGGV